MDHPRKVTQQKRGRVKAPQLRMRGSAHTARTKTRQTVPSKAPVATFHSTKGE